MNRIEKSLDLKKQGYNCAQAVIIAYADVVNLDEELAQNIGAGFGSGLGNMKGTCGAILGGGCIMGIAFKDKVVSKSFSKEIMTKFEASNKSTVCYDLKGIGTGTPLRSCMGCVSDTAQLVEDILKREGKL